MNNSITKKREQFHSQIRSEYLQNYMKKIRYEIMQQLNYSQSQTLNNLIQSTTTQINQQQLKSLLKYANQSDQNNAIIHLGNLLIDQIVSIDCLLLNFLLQPKNSQYWLWLVRVILTIDSNHNQTKYQQAYLQWQQKVVQYVLNRFLTTQQSFSLIECLEIIKILLGKQKEKVIQSVIINYQGVLIKVKDTCVHFNKKVSQLSYEIIDEIIEFGDDSTQQLVRICSVGEIQRILILGFNKLDPSQKKFPLIICRMVNNILASRVSMSRKMIKACINMCLNRHNRQRVRVQFSYVWLSFSETCGIEQLRYGLQQRLLYAFQSILCSVDKEKQKSRIIVDNIENSLMRIVEKLDGLGRQDQLKERNRLKETDELTERNRLTERNKLIEKDELVETKSSIGFLLNECKQIRTSVDRKKVESKESNLMNRNREKEMINRYSQKQNKVVEKIDESSMDLE